MRKDFCDNANGNEVDQLITSPRERVLAKDALMFFGQNLSGRTWFHPDIHVYSIVLDDGRIVDFYSSTKILYDVRRGGVPRFGPAVSASSADPATKCSAPDRHAPDCECAAI